MEVAPKEKECIKRDYWETMMNIPLPQYVKSHLSDCETCRDTVLTIDMDSPIGEKPFGKPFNEVRNQWIRGLGEQKETEDFKEGFFSKLKLFQKTKERPLQVLMQIAVSLTVLEGIYLILRWLLQ